MIDTFAFQTFRSLLYSSSIFSLSSRALTLFCLRVLRALASETFTVPDDDAGAGPKR